MTTAHRLGYDAEHAIALYLASWGYGVERPRAGSHQDRGDLLGLPVVVSVKNHRGLDLSGWVGALPGMCAAAGLDHGVVWHKRRGRSSPGEWYVTTTGDTFIALLRGYETYRARWLGEQEETPA